MIQEVRLSILNSELYAMACLSQIFKARIGILQISGVYLFVLAAPDALGVQLDVHLEYRLASEAHRNARGSLIVMQLKYHRHVVQVCDVCCPTESCHVVSRRLVLCCDVPGHVVPCRDVSCRDLS